MAGPHQEGQSGLVGRGGTSVHKMDTALFRQGLPDILPVAVIEIEHQLAPVALDAVDNACQVVGFITARNGRGIDNELNVEGKVWQIL